MNTSLPRRWIRFNSTGVSLRVRPLPSNFTASERALLPNSESWQNTLHRVSDNNGVIVFSAGTSSYVGIMNTFFKIAIQAHGIKNFVFVALSNGMCRTGAMHGALDSSANCFRYPTTFPRGGIYGSADFAKVVQVKTDILLSIVQLGYTALLTDVDIFFLQNPLPELRMLSAKHSAHLLIQDDAQGGRNSGFMYVTPSSSSVAYLSRVIDAQQKDPKLRQQLAVNRVLQSFDKNSLTVHVLPPATWPCGAVFFQRQARRMFAWHHTCTNCLVVHNNWIVGDDAKEYRAKEFLQWSNDEDGYYSSSTLKYIYVGNPDPNVSKVVEEGALRAALMLGEILNRILILPWLRCRPNCKDQGCQPGKGDLDICALNSRYYVKSWNRMLGPQRWREMMFRYNPLTHKNVRLTHNLVALTQWAASDDRVHAKWIDPVLPQSGIDSLASPQEQAHFISSRGHTQPKEYGNVFRHESPVSKVIVHSTFRDQIISWQEAHEKWNSSSQVLRFHSLYNIQVIMRPKDQEFFQKCFSEIFKEADLKQF